MNDFEGDGTPLRPFISDNFDLLTECQSYDMNSYIRFLGYEYLEWKHIMSMKRFVIKHLTRFDITRIFIRVQELKYLDTFNIYGVDFSTHRLVFYKREQNSNVIWEYNSNIYSTELSLGQLEIPEKQSGIVRASVLNPKLTDIHLTIFDDFKLHPRIVFDLGIDNDITILLHLIEK